MDKDTIKRVLVDQKDEVQRYQLQLRPDYYLDNPMGHILVGVRRAGKSFVMYQIMRQLIEKGSNWNEILYLDFEDNRFEQFTSEDFQRLIECHIELYGIEPHYFFLDELQNIDGWDRFARKLADTKHIVYVTGSNAKILSKEFAARLGGRYLEKDIFPYSFKEYLTACNVAYDSVTMYSTKGGALVRKAYQEYLVDGGLPESLLISPKRNYLSSTFQKIYLSDIASHNNISNITALRLLIKKMAESVRQPISYNRLTNILSSIGEKLSTATVINYVNYCEDAWLLLRLRNINGALGEKESICKYYFVDNGILNLFLIGGETALLENMVALQLFRLFGHDRDNDTVYFYSSNGYEVDFYIPEKKWAIQVSYSLQGEDTRKREVAALTKLPNVLECERRTIITYDETGSIEDARGTIEVLPCWKWMLE